MKWSSFLKGFTRLTCQDLAKNRERERERERERVFTYDKWPPVQAEFDNPLIYGSIKVKLFL